MKQLAVVILIIAGIAGLNLGVNAERDVVTALSILWVIAVLWLSEALHITVTALLVPLLASITGLLDMNDALKNFANPIIYLFLGGFALAIAMHVQGLDKWLADQILARTKGRLDRAFLMLAAATTFISMWISNTATTALMLPLVLGLIAEKEDLPLKTQVFALLLIAYSANIGGIGTIIGTAPNALVAAELNISFVDWLKFGVPVVLVLWPLVVGIMWWLIKPDFLDNCVAVEKTRFEWTAQRRMLIAIFGTTILCWLFSRPLSSLLGIEKNFDTWVAIAAIVMIGITRVASWQQFERNADWGVLLLFGGGLTLSEILKTSGASSFLGIGLANVIADWGMVLILLMLVAFVVYLTEVTSNTATTALLVPVFISLPAGIIEPASAAIAIGISSSCAFMLPVATPPNALVHGTGRVSQRAMMHTGFFLNLGCIVALTAFFAVYKLS